MSAAPPTASPLEASGRVRLAAFAAVVLAAVLPFLDSLGGEFVFDDRFQIVENDQLRSLANLPRFFAADVWAAVGLPYSSYYRPLMYTSFAFEFAAVGDEPWLYRGTNLALHAGASLLLLGLLRRTGAGLAAAAAAGVLFALHPMHAEVVAWPSARPELLVTVFTLAAAFVHAGSDAATGATRGRFLAVGGLVLCALFSKETGVLAPVAIGLVALLRAPEPDALGRIGSGVRAALPYLALIAVFLGVRSLAIEVEGMPPLHDPDAAGPMPATPMEAVLRVGGIAGRYLREMLLPLDASSFRVPSSENVRGGLPFLLLGLAALAGAPWWAPAAWLAFAFLGIALQSLGVPHAGYLAQRYAYLPSAGTAAALALLLATLGRPGAATWRRALAGAAFVALVTAYATWLLPRVREWTTEQALWTAAYERDPEAPAVLGNYAYLLVEQGRAADALPLFERLEQVEPGGWGAPYGRANALMASGRPGEAIPFYREAIRREPKIPHLYRSLGFAHEDLGEYEEARRVFGQALALFPDSSVGRGVLGVLAAKEGDAEAALAETEAALARRPDLAQLRLNRVVLLAQLGRVDEAIAAGEALARDPELGSEGHRSLGVLYDRYRRAPARALQHYEEALRLAPDRADATELRRRVQQLRRELGVRVLRRDDGEES